MASVAAPKPHFLYPRIALMLAGGLAIGVLTSFGQGHLNTTFSPLVNSASAWLVAPFLVGATMKSARGGGTAGLMVCLLELVGYSLASEMRGFGNGGSMVVFWSCCALVGGPLFGAAGQLWRDRSHQLHSLAKAVLPAAFLAEGLWVYVHELHYLGAAALWITIGLVLSAVVVRSVQDGLWLLAAVAAGLFSEALLTLVYSQSF